jgi:hypothetical protein
MLRLLNNLTRNRTGHRIQHAAFSRRDRPYFMLLFNQSLHRLRWNLTQYICNSAVFRFLLFRGEHGRVNGEFASD